MSFDNVKRFPKIVERKQIPIVGVLSHIIISVEPNINLRSCVRGSVQSIQARDELTCTGKEANVFDIGPFFPCYFKNAWIAGLRVWSATGQYRFESYDDRVEVPVIRRVDVSLNMR